MFNIDKAKKAQLDLCIKNEYPHFAPATGVCWSCRRNIYEEITHSNGHKTGVQVEKADSELITGCPHCNRSYCD